MLCYFNYVTIFNVVLKLFRIIYSVQKLKVGAPYGDLHYNPL